jgi:hypothetical protein
MADRADHLACCIGVLDRRASAAPS